MNKNPLHQKIYEKVVKPELDAISHDAEAIVLAINYYDQVADIQWTDGRTGSLRQARNVILPIDADGIYRQSVKVGDKVRVAFKHGDFAFPYITMIYKNTPRRSDFYAKYGPSIPRGI